MTELLFNNIAVSDVVLPLKESRFGLDKLPPLVYCTIMANNYPISDKAQTAPAKAMLDRKRETDEVYARWDIVYGFSFVRPISVLSTGNIIEGEVISKRIISDDSQHNRPVHRGVL